MKIDGKDVWKAIKNRKIGHGVGRGMPPLREEMVDEGKKESIIRELRWGLGKKPQRQEEEI